MTPPEAETANAKLLRVAIWVAIGALIAAAVVCVIMVLLGSANGIVWRAFLTILLMVAFSGVALLDTHLAPRRPVWFALTSMVVWVVTLLIGAVMIWLPFREFGGYEFGGGAGRFLSFLLIVLILQLGVLHVRLYVKAWDRHRTTFTSIVAWVTIVLVALLALALVFPLMLSEWVHFYDIYWRLTVAIAILAAVGTALVPLVNALFAPHRAAARPAGVPQGWPTYADGVTPLPVLPDGQPDWNAYYTGYPTQVYPAVDAAPAAPAPAPVPAQAWPAPEPAPAVAPEPQARPYVDPYATPAEPDWPAPAAQPPAAQPPAAPGYGDYPPPPPLPGQR
ncbi:hypothetical protein [Microbacterium sp. KR10-403]|uniref:hypothetical protein n=1 Tax=Microbacterium sp. KR10-403 TaxID=3158581 RepID=UPI0032E3ED6A